MLLADVIESIYYGRIGSDTERQARKATDLVSKLRIDNALPVGALARSSLQGQEPTMYRHFHDSLNEVAFPVEPLTVVFIHSFAKAEYICLESFQMPGKQNMLAECFQQNCEFCIHALQYLGRKSDVAFLVARNLSSSFELKLSQSMYIFGTGLVACCHYLLLVHRPHESGFRPLVGCVRGTPRSHQLRVVHHDRHISPEYPRRDGRQVHASVFNEMYGYR